MKISIEVENVRCGGCANTITKKLMSLEGVEGVDIATEDNIVTIEAQNDSNRDAYIEALLAMGYPEKGSVAGLAALKGKAKSIVSCAIGKVT
ncbi:MAG: heavy metal transporter [Methylophaga sp.]|nr:MAG: heavy metal transporter [Methylophaga sp.]